MNLFLSEVLFRKIMWKIYYIFLQFYRSIYHKIKYICRNVTLEISFFLFAFIVCEITKKFCTVLLAVKTEIKALIELELPIFPYLVNEVRVVRSSTSAKFDTHKPKHSMTKTARSWKRFVTITFIFFTSFNSQLYSNTTHRTHIKWPSIAEHWSKIEFQKTVQRHDN